MGWPYPCRRCWVTLVAPLMQENANVNSVEPPMALQKQRIMFTSQTRLALMITTKRQFFMKAKNTVRYLWYVDQPVCQMPNATSISTSIHRYMKISSKARVGTMMKKNTTTRPKELCPKVIIIVRWKFTLKSIYNEDYSTIRLQCTTMHPKGLIVKEQWVSHISVLHITKQDCPCCLMLIHGVHAILLSVLPCHSDNRFLFSQPHEDALMPSPLNKGNTTLHNNCNALVYITNR